MSAEHAGRRRIAIVGGGFGGVAAARALRRVNVDVTVVDRTNHQLFQPLLYQAATGGLSAGECATKKRFSDHTQIRARTLAQVTVLACLSFRKQGEG